MSAELENLVLVRSTEPIEQSIATIETAWSDAARKYGTSSLRLSKDDQESLGEWATRARDTLADMEAKISIPAARTRQGHQDERGSERVFPFVSYRVILDTFSTLARDQTGPFKQSFEKQLQVLEGAVDQSEIVSRLWETIVRRASSQVEADTRVEAKSVMERVLKQAKTAELYDHFVKFSETLGLEWNVLKPNERTKLLIEARMVGTIALELGLLRLAGYLSRSKTNAAAVDAGQAYPHPTSRYSLPLIGRVLAKPVAVPVHPQTEGGIPGLEHLGPIPPRPEHSLAPVSHRQRALYGFAHTI